MIKEGYENKKVVEVPIEIVKNNGMYICKNKINLSNGVEIVGYKEKRSNNDIAKKLNFYKLGFEDFNLE